MYFIFGVLFLFTKKMHKSQKIIINQLKRKEHYYDLGLSLQLKLRQGKKKKARHKLR